VCRISLDGSFGVLTAVTIQVAFFCIVTPCSFEDGGSKVLRNAGILPQHHKHHNPEELDLKVHLEFGLKPMYLEIIAQCYSAGLLAG
jgi:hypothetical protein